MGHLVLRAVSSGPRWKGVHLELGEAAGWGGEDLMVNGHFLSMNRMTTPLHILIRNDDSGSWTPRVLAPGAFLIHPEGSPFSLRLTSHCDWSGAIIDGGALDEMLGSHHELRGEVNVFDPLLETLFRGLIAELVTPGANADVTRSVIDSFMLALGRRHGHKATELPDAGLGKAALDELSLWLASRLETRLTVGQMASRLGLSAAHFSREFKLATGRPPWEYVIEIRLQRAADLLKRGTDVSAVALDCGFFDQAHLSRAFKKRFGSSPSSYARGHSPLNPE